MRSEILQKSKRRYLLLILIAAIFLEVILLAGNYEKFELGYHVAISKQEAIIDIILLFVTLGFAALIAYLNLKEHSFVLNTAITYADILSGQFGSLIDAIPANIALLDEQGIITDVNKAWIEFAKENGLASENYGIGVNYLYLAESNTRLSNALRKMIAGKINKFSIVYTCHAPGKKRWFRLIAARDNTRKSNPIILMHIDITTLYQANDKMKQTQDNLKQIIDLVPHLIFARDADGTINFVNKRFAELYGFDSPEYFINKKFTDFIPVAEEGKKFLQEDASVIATGQTKVFPNDTFTDRKNDLHYFNTTKVCYTPAGVSKRGILGVAIEITDEKKAELELKKAEANYREIFEKGNDGIFILDIETGAVINVNEQACNITGYSKEELLASDPSGISKLGSCIVQKYSGTNVLLGVQRGVGKEYQVRKKDGSTHWIEISCSTATIAGVQRIISFFREIDNRKNAEEALKKSESELRALFAAMTDIVVVLNGEGEYINIAPTNPCKKHQPSQTVISKKIQDILPAEEAQKISAYIHESLSGKRLVNFEYKMGDNENVAWFESGLSPLSENSVFWVSRNITARKLVELEHDRTLKELMRKNKDLEQFAYIVSHNLRAPVSNILGITNALHTMQLGVETRNQLKADQVACVKKLDDVIKDLNYILQVKSEITENKELVKFSEIVASIRLCIENLIRKEHVIFVTDFTEADEIITFRSYLYSILFNLITNSIKYRQPHIHPVIEISIKKHDDTIVLIFKDNGMGIDMDKNDKQVFGLYKRFHLHKDGKGMGLFMTKTQVEMLGGKISVNSVINSGTTFTIEFPNQL